MKQTTDMPELFVSEDARTWRVPRVEDVEAPTTRRIGTHKATLTSRGRRATFTVDSITDHSATLTGPLTFTVGDRVCLTLEVDGEERSVAGEIVGVATADLLNDHVTVALTEPVLDRPLR